MTAQRHDALDNGRTDGRATVWRRPPRELMLPVGQVHVWRAEVAQHTSALTDLSSILSPAEQERANRFYFVADRERFVVAHGLLRVLLGRYLREAPQMLRFSDNPHGKPALAPSSDQAGLRFNLSHSQGLVMYAVARGREVGVDVEQIRLVADFERIAEQFFSPAERKELRTLRTECKLDGFFGLWTLKEAYVKAWGQGLSVPLHDFSVSLQPDASGNFFLTPGGDDRQCADWSLRRLTPGPGYVGALAVEGHDWELNLWELHDGFNPGGMRDEG
ncbi:MAG: 4'-phosphopantetheinyl transferase superfamily protein [Candidatus Anammoximicrobium sp.]|nr:4'-phosphopantetheinyl transferase superfamily protein [Candidatus Anammoximicrobium sp.]